MYGKDKKWMELQKEISLEVMEAREARGAGEKPVRQKFDKDYIAEGSGLSKVVSSSNRPVVKEPTNFIYDDLFAPAANSTMLEID